MCVHIYGNILYQNSSHMSEKRICNFKCQMLIIIWWKDSKFFDWHLRSCENWEIKYFSFHFQSDAFCRKKNLTSHYKFLTEEKKLNELSFKEPFDVEWKLGPEIQYRQRGSRIGPRYRHGIFIVPAIHHRGFWSRYGLRPWWHRDGVIYRYSCCCLLLLLYLYCTLQAMRVA